MRIYSMCLTALIAAAPACAADNTCAAVFDAIKKVVTTPTHAYNTRTSGRHPNQPQQSETIYTGGMSGAIFLKANGQWTHSVEKPSEVQQQQDENIRNSKSACRYLRDETLNGEAAAVYSARTEHDETTQESTVWIANGRGLPLQEEIDSDVGGGAMGKSHTSIRYEYSNVRPPDGVK